MFDDENQAPEGGEEAAPEGEAPAEGAEGGADGAAEGEGGGELALNELQGDGVVAEGEELGDPGQLQAVYNVPVQVSAVLGQATMPVNQLLKLGRGAVVELDRRVGESIDIFVNNKLVARGEVVIVEDRLGITMTEIIKTEQAS